MALKIVKKEESSEFASLKGLNEKQAEAVKAINGPVLIVAGAGSGKTRTLTQRIAHLIERGVKPWNILALTFTNKAAQEMRSRIANIVDPEAAAKIWAGTFHSIFARILRFEADKIGYTSSYTIYDQDDSLSLVKNVMNSLVISLQQYPPAGVQHRISSAKNKMIGWKEYAEIASTNLEMITGQIYEAYDKALYTNNAMDFDDILLNMINLLAKHKDILHKYQERFTHILVDEYQDTNRAQYVAINLLAKARQNLCVVGDDAQSIYKWRGAEIQNIIDFQKDYPFAKVIRLEQNYRSTKNILGAAGSVIKNNRRQIPKELWTDNPEGELLQLINCSDDREEAIKIVSLINSNIGGDYTYKDIAVLYRTNAQSLALENAMRSARHPYVIVGGISFYKRKEIKDAMAYLRLLVNPADSESVRRIINEPPRGLGKTSLQHLTNFAADKGITLLEAFERAPESGELQKRSIIAAQKFASMIGDARSRLQHENQAKAALDFIEQTGLLEMYKEIGTEDALDRWNNIQQLLSDIALYFRRTEEASLDDYIQQLSLVADIDEKDISQNRVAMMTLHSAKGLEFPIVIIAGMEQGLFPLAKAEMDTEEEEEERRLFYVGITRAEEKVYMTYCNRRMRFGETTFQSPSKFLKEIDSKYIKGAAAPVQDKPKPQSGLFAQRPQPKTPAKQQYFDDGGDNYNYSQIPEDYNIRVGDTVEHSKFGRGRVTAMRGVGAQKSAIVDFPGIGRKTLMLQFAKLKRV